MTATILRSTSGSNTQVAVEVAWGGSPTATEASLTWTDITADVLHQSKISISIGRQDESQTANPGTCTFVVDNRTGKYSRAPQSTNYPNVRHGTPIRVRVINASVSRTRFFGNAVGFTPSWDTSGKYAVVKIEAAGYKRRIKQQRSPLKSALTRSIPKLASLVAYWPCEDGSRSASFLPGIPGVQPLNINAASPNLSAYSGFLGSESIPTLTAGESWSASIPTYSASTSGQVRFLLFVPTSAAGVLDQHVISEISTSGTIARVRLIYRSGGSLELVGHTVTGALVFDSGPIGFGINDQPSLVGFQWTQTGGTITFVMTQLPAGIAGLTTGFTSSQSVVATLDAVNNITISPDGGVPGVSIGQITFQSTTDSIFTLNLPLNAYLGENVSTRMSRLATEQGELFTTFTANSDIAMGPQSTTDFLSLMEEAALADGGILFDGTVAASGSGGGLMMVPRKVISNNGISLALTASQLSDALQVVDDDQGIVNQFTASRPNAGAVTYTDTSSSLSVANIGLYDGSAEVNLQFDTMLPDYASWKVSLGTVDDYRYPSLSLGLHNNYSLVPSWQGIVPGNLVTLDGVTSIASQQDTAQIKMLLEGWTETIDQYTWDVTVNCSPARIWTTGTLASDTGDSSTVLVRLDTDGCSISARPSTTTLTVVSTKGLWTTVADDLPFDINVLGVKYSVTGVANVSGLTQTLTLSSTIPSTVVGAAVTLWRPYVPAR